jgi:uncharacterized protein (DUF983 family)
VSPVDGGPAAGGANPYIAGLRGRCPQCGEGPLFGGFLKVAPRCTVCGRDFAAAESGDGPAVFIILIVGFLACFGALFFDLAIHPPIWLIFVIWMPIGAGASLALIRPLKGLMIAAQFVNKAAEARNDDR